MRRLPDIILNSLFELSLSPLKHDYTFARTIIFPTYKLKAKVLAEILNDESGIPCTKIDVDNAEEITAYAPHRLPNTQEIRIKLGLLKHNLSPKKRN